MSNMMLAPEVHKAVRQLRTIYHELCDIRQHIETQHWNELSPILDNDLASPSGGTVARAVFTRLYRTITGHGFGMPGDRDRNGVAGVDVGYVMAAVADEMLLHGPPWPGQDSWAATLLEEALYGTRIAGERIFRMAHDIIKGRTTRPELAAAILVCIILGFRGRYHGVDDHGELATLKERLFVVVFHRPCPTLGSLTDLLDDGALAPPLDQLSLRSLPPLRPWLTALLLLPFIYVVLSYGIWSNAVSDLVARSDRIIHASSPKLLQ